MKPSQIFLITSIVTFGVGLLDPGESVFWFMMRPIGAVLFMLYFIFQLLDKEVALLDEQERKKMELLSRHIQQPAPIKPSPARSSRPLTTAALHR